MKIFKDIISPTIAVTLPTSFVTPNEILVNLNDNQSGIDWAKTIFSCNGLNIQINRVGATNTFIIPISSLPPNSDNVFTITILTYDFAGNSNSFSQTYPCISELTVHSVFDENINPFILKALKFIYSDGNMPQNNKVILRLAVLLFYYQDSKLKPVVFLKHILVNVNIKRIRYIECLSNRPNG